ncbi:MAG TPA: YIP1 family protein [Candidatus Acidoferrales bacterium]|nr:YIP1 family protein [Candidatus Acidoferrales bacterium]
MTPFLTIWTEPRATIRRIVDTDPTRYVVAIAAAGPAISALADEWSKAMSDSSNLSVLWPLWVAADVTAQAVVGVVFLYIGAAILTWSGGLIGGVASNVEMRAATAWSQVPGVAAAIVLLIAVLMGVPVPQVIGSTLPSIDPAFYKVLLVELVLGLWSGIIGLYCIAEVHRFSTWRAFWTTLIPALVAMVVLGIVVGVFYALVAHH